MSAMAWETGLDSGDGLTATEYLLGSLQWASEVGKTVEMVKRCRISTTC